MVEKIMVNSSVPAVLSRLSQFVVWLVSEGKAKSCPLLTAFVLTPKRVSGLAVRKAVGAFFSPGPMIYR